MVAWNAHELLMEILNSGAAIAANVNNLTQFNVVCGCKSITLCLLISV